MECVVDIRLGDSGCPSLIWLRESFLVKVTNGAASVIGVTNGICAAVAADRTRFRIFFTGDARQSIVGIAASLCGITCRSPNGRRCDIAEGIVYVRRQKPAGG